MQSRDQHDGSRGDREEVFGGIGQSWKGYFVGGRYLVLAVTQGALNERLYGNFPEYTFLPEADSARSLVSATAR